MLLPMKNKIVKTLSVLGLVLSTSVVSFAYDYDDDDAVIEECNAIIRAAKGKSSVRERQLAMELWRKDIEPTFLEILQGEHEGMTRFGAIEKKCLQEYIDDAQEYLEAWPKLERLRGNFLVGMKYSLESVIKIKKAAKRGMEKVTEEALPFDFSVFE